MSGGTGRPCGRHTWNRDSTLVGLQRVAGFNSEFKPSEMSQVAFCGEAHRAVALVGWLGSTRLRPSVTGKRLFRPPLSWGVDVQHH
jgi:hypothetical protein